MDAIVVQFWDEPDGRASDRRDNRVLGSIETRGRGADRRSKGRDGKNIGVGGSNLVSAHIKKWPWFGRARYSFGNEME